MFIHGEMFQESIYFPKSVNLKTCYRPNNQQHLPLTKAGPIKLYFDAYSNIAVTV